jgi:hypothetical protein
VIPSEIQDLAGAVGTLAGGAGLANEDGSESAEVQRRLKGPDVAPGRSTNRQT